MEISFDNVQSFADSGAGGAEAAHVDRTISNTPPNEKQGPAGNMLQIPRNPFDDKIDELEQKLAALTAGNSPSMSSDASFRTAQEQLSPNPLSRKPPRKRKECKVPKTSPRSSRNHSITAAQSASPPTTSHGPSTRASTRPSTRRSSTAPTSQVPSASSSKREGRAPPSIQPSASISNRVATTPNSRIASSKPSTLNPDLQTAAHPPTLRTRRNNNTWPSLTTVPNGRQRLQSVRAFSALQQDVHNALASEQRLRSTSLPVLSPPPPHNPNSPTPPLEYTNHIPATTIDWTLPSTRRREYEKIDRARRGWRGLVRRVTPRFARRGGRMGFHGEEGGSVRRFRVDVGGGGGGGAGGGGGGDEGGGEGGGDEGGGGGEGVRGRRAWWKFGFGKGKGKGKRKGVVRAEGDVASGSG